MQIGLMGLGGTLDEIVEGAVAGEAAGFTSYALANIFGHDAIGALTLAGARTSRIELLTAVVPTYPRHPGAIAQQALTASAAAHGRFTLGIGLSHKVVIEGMYGMSFDRPARPMREYLSILMPLLHGQPVQFEGESSTFRGGLVVTDVNYPVPCVIAAMAPAMLRLAGALADGTVLWMAGAKAIRDHVAPRVRAAAADAGRPEPRVICALPIALTNNAAAARELADKQFEVYGRLPSYRAMLDRQGAATPAKAALIGDEAALDAALRELEESGVTQFNGALFDDGAGSVPRTHAFLAERARTWAAAHA
ncbi:MAG: TIGR03564 family F420-dependent LLM class oxidoreductase [Chloroflexi bacterium]|nr:TIGR03564 family F420-dependent LLM class oxidoreductase [Chloroflexota bacterium]MQC27585.1 TIGR03564 family F420-dependent LLM class oxidoreductase [Chloroflexota bacterium]